ncbi:hypothetical protein ACIQNG_25545 [Streptomyces sp. NPDC091377]|uniref:hypothetical protein n=1 Tax=Streptomyces sp. NPDC091377 TaxID=3365995 RepID=UPI00382C5B90
MTMADCAVCHRDTTPGTHICPGHGADLRAWLAELPALAQLLAEEFVAPAGGRDAGRPGGAGRATVPADLRVLNLLGPGRADPTGPDDDGEAPLLALLSAWAGYIAYTYPTVTRDRHGTVHSGRCAQAVPRAGRAVPGWCAWLTAYLPYAAAHPWIGDLHHQLGRLTTRIRDLTHAVPHKHPQSAPCPECDAYALAAVDGRWGITCEACGHHLDPDAYAAHARTVLNAA